MGEKKLEDFSRTESAFKLMQRALESGLNAESAFDLAVDCYDRMAIRPIAEAPKDQEIDIRVLPRFSYIGEMGIFRRCKWDNETESWRLNPKQTLKDLDSDDNWGDVVGWKASKSPIPWPFSEDFFQHELRRRLLA